MARDNRVYLFPMAAFVIGIVAGLYFIPTGGASASAPSYFGVVVDQAGVEDLYPGTTLCNAAVFEERGRTPGAAWCVCQHEKAAKEQGYLSWQIVDTTGEIGNGVVSTNGFPLYQRTEMARACEDLVR